MLPTIKFRSLSLACLVLIVIFSAPELASAPAPGETFRDCPDCPEMVVIPAGRFQMGDKRGHWSSDGTSHFFEWEARPVHEVHIAQPFAMGRYEVTFAEYDRYLQATGKEKHFIGGVSKPRIHSHPVYHVDKHDAQDYVKWLSQETGQRYRLPSEAEWEYAARAGSTTDFYWGNNYSDSVRDADIVRYANTGSEDDGFIGLAPVGSLQPNQFGLYDMSGNVAEMVEDCWNRNYEDAPTDGSAWVTGSRGRDYCSGVTRGGHYGLSGVGVTSYARSEGEGGPWIIGFRVARTL